MTKEITLSATNQTSGVGAYSSNPVPTPAQVDASDAPPVVADTPSPIASLASGIGSIVLFPGRLVVQQFAGTGDPLDMSHLPVTILLSLGAWYGLYWYLTKPGGLFHSKGDK
jgi:hypothetical protein